MAGGLSIMQVQLIILLVLLLGFIISVTILGACIEYKVRKEYEEQCSKSKGKGKEASSDNASSYSASSDNADITINCFIDSK